MASSRTVPKAVLRWIRVKAYDLHANCYITKPVGLEQFISVVKSIEEFWVAIVSLPPDGAGT